MQSGHLFSRLGEEIGEEIRSALQSGGHFRSRITVVVAVHVGLRVNDEAVDVRELQTVNFNADCKDAREWQEAIGGACFGYVGNPRGIGSGVGDGQKSARTGVPMVWAETAGGAISVVQVAPRVGLSARDRRDIAIGDDIAGEQVEAK